MARASRKLKKRGLTEIHDVGQKEAIVLRVQVRWVVGHGEVVMSRSGKLERERGGDAGESVIRSARKATAAAVGAVHLKWLPMVKETLL